MNYYRRPIHRHIPQPLFKYLPEEHAVGMVERGSVRIGTAHDFRRIEAHNPARSDSTEAKPGSLAFIDDIEITKDRPMPVYLEKFFDVDSGPARIQGLIVDETEPDQDYYIYCVTGQHQKYLYHFFDVNSCVAIRDVVGFFKCLADHLTSLIQGSVFARVTYGSRFGSLSAAHDRPPPFVKPPQYSWQDELRMVCLPKSAVQVEPFNTEVPGLGQFCELISRDRMRSGG